MSNAQAIRAGRAYIEFFIRKHNLEQGLDALRARLKKFQSFATRIGTGLFTGGALLMAPFIKGIQIASETQEAMNRLRLTFGNLTQDAIQFGEALATLTGRDRGEVLDVFSGFASFLKTRGNFPGLEPTIGKRLTKMAADLSSFADVSFEEAARDIAQALRGVSTAVRKYNLDLSDSTLKSVLARRGITGIATAAQKTAARIELMVEQMDMKEATGDAENTLHQFANALRAFMAQIKDIGRAIGDALLPTLQRVLPVMRGILTLIRNWIRSNGNFVFMIFKWSLIITALGVAFLGLGAAIAVVWGGLWLFTTFPFAAIIAGFTGIVAALAAMIPKLDDVIKRLIGMKVVWSQLIAAIVAADPQMIGLAIDNVFRAIELSFLKWIQSLQNDLKDLALAIPGGQALLDAINALGLDALIKQKGAQLGGQILALDVMLKAWQARLKALTEDELDIDALWEGVMGDQAGRGKLREPVISRTALLGSQEAFKFLRPGGQMDVQKEQLRELRAINKGVQDLKNKPDGLVGPAEFRFDDKPHWRGGHAFPEEDPNYFNQPYPLNR